MELISAFLTLCVRLTTIALYICGFCISWLFLAEKEYVNALAMFMLSDVFMIANYFYMKNED